MKRRWRKAVLLAVLAVYLPTLVPFAVGPLTECGHCVRNYLTALPIVPGLVAGALVGPAAPVAAAVAAAGLLTAALLAAATALARRLPARDLAAAFVVLMPLIGLESHAFAVMLRA